MKAAILKYLLLSNLLIGTLAKGGGGGKGGGSKGGSSGGSGESSGSGEGSGSSGGSSSGGSSGGSGKVSGGGSGTFSQPKTGSVSNVGSYNFPSGSKGYSGGGYGYYNPSVGASGRNTRGVYSNYYPTYGGGYGYGYPYGWYGFYNPALLYWSIIPLGFYAGYHSTYHRYNGQDGAYYAPLISSQNSGSADAMINGTAYTDDNTNYHYTYAVTTSTGYPAIAAAFYATSDYSATPADYAYRLTFWQMVEFTDSNNNGVLDDGEQVAVTIPLQGSWSPIQIANKTSPTNSSLTYLEGQTTASINASNKTFNATLIFRVANVEINNTFAITYVPNSAEYEFSTSGYSASNPANRLALLQILSSDPSIPAATDINSTTSAADAALIKTNQTYGVSIGSYSEGRLEYNNQLNLTNVTFGSYVGQASQLVLGNLTSLDNWIWTGKTINDTSVLAVTLPSANNASTAQTIAGFAFMDVDVLNVEASSAGSKAVSPGMKSISSILLPLVSVAIVTFVF